MRSLHVRIVVLVAVAGCVVMRPPTISERPRWRITADVPWQAGCVAGRAFVRKSGKQGIGIAIQLRSVRDCRVQLAGGRLVFADGGVVAIPEMTTLELRGRSILYAWLPVRFDNNAAWNAEHDDAELELAYRVDGVTAPAWRLALHQGAP